mmetsp:Transcript_12878/g.19009  ORF Transcript_12878/g.19009 Transcript_12878/m.19009 type:complete len:359 (-) Transcript_12878:176-1252(-)
MKGLEIEIGKKCKQEVHEFVISPVNHIQDAESGVAKKNGSLSEARKTYSSQEQAIWLGLWTVNNIAVTLMNKSVFHNLDFNYPYTLSAVHMLVNSLGAYLYSYYSGNVQHKKLDWLQQKIILGFSILFAANIAVGNLSLRYVSVNFNQVMRSLVPAVVMGMSCCALKLRYSPRRQCSVIPVVAGVAMACYGEMRFNSIGFLVTALCVVLAALKVVVSGLALRGSIKLHPIDLLTKMAPLAGLECLAMAYISGEMQEILLRWQRLTEMGAIYVVVFTGFLAFFLNLTSFQANKVTSPLTLTIAANAKQALLMMMSTFLFGVVVSPLNMCGIVIVIAGSSLYSYISQCEKMAANNSSGAT